MRWMAAYATRMRWMAAYATRMRWMATYPLPASPPSSIPSSPPSSPPSAPHPQSLLPPPLPLSFPTLLQLEDRGSSIHVLSPESGAPLGLLMPPFNVLTPRDPKGNLDPKRSVGCLTGLCVDDDALYVGTLYGAPRILRLMREVATRPTFSRPPQQATPVTTPAVAPAPAGSTSGKTPVPSPPTGQVGGDARTVAGAAPSESAHAAPAGPTPIEIK